MIGTSSTTARLSSIADALNPRAAAVRRIADRQEARRVDGFWNRIGDRVILANAEGHAATLKAYMSPMAPGTGLGVIAATVAAFFESSDKGVVRPFFTGFASMGNVS